MQGTWLSRCLTGLISPPNRLQKTVAGQENTGKEERRPGGTRMPHRMRTYSADRPFFYPRNPSKSQKSRNARGPVCHHPLLPHRKESTWSIKSKSSKYARMVTPPYREKPAEVFRQIGPHTLRWAVLTRVGEIGLISRRTKNSPGVKLQKVLYNVP